jgi:hypothetical protein
VAVPVRARTQSCHTAVVENDLTLLRVRGGELAGTGSWVYVWVRLGARERPVIYVGATGLPPAVRTWLHLHDDDPDVGRLAARYTGLAREEMDVLAFPVPERLARPLVKAAVIQRLHRLGLVAERYVGDPADSQPSPDDVAETAERIVAAVMAHGRDGDQPRGSGR